MPTVRKPSRAELVGYAADLARDRVLFDPTNDAILLAVCEYFGSAEIPLDYFDRVAIIEAYDRNDREEL